MRTLLALLACVLLAAAPLDAQTIYRPSEVTVSGDIVTIEGKQYFSHVVRNRQTLYSIGKAYGVSSLDIIDANPSLNLDRRPIKAGDVLLIPATEKALAAMQEAAASAGTPAEPSKAHALAGTVSQRADSLVVRTDSVAGADSLTATSTSLIAGADSLLVVSDSTAV